jgi:hypothetical protein
MLYPLLFPASLTILIAEKASNAFDLLFGSCAICLVEVLNQDAKTGTGFSSGASVEPGRNNRVHQ